MHFVFLLPDGLLNVYLNTGASCKACFCIHRFCEFPGEVLSSTLLCLLLLIKCGMSLTRSVHTKHFCKCESVLVR